MGIYVPPADPAPSPVLDLRLTLEASSSSRLSQGVTAGAAGDARTVTVGKETVKVHPILDVGL